jgi:hypothetical protein
MINNNDVENDRAFTNADRLNANEAHAIYMYEINGIGLRWEFDGRPDRMQYVLGRASDFLAQITYFQERLVRFARFIEILESFKDRPISHAHPLGWDPTYPKTITRVITERAIGAYKEMLIAFTTYKDCLLQYGPASSEVAEAAHTAAYTVNPETWRLLGAPVPENANSYASLSTRWYLEAIMLSATSS